MGEALQPGHGRRDIPGRTRRGKQLHRERALLAERIPPGAEARAKQQSWVNAGTFPGYKNHLGEAGNATATKAEHGEVRAP